ncbi:MAG: sulfur oxidation c-type cytochrome SoxX [Hyphomicrobiales bacterium]|nr:sulfur oxidation c-type cytochrome SoxX [Hyphomicrobiales bacterium]
MKKARGYTLAGAMMAFALTAASPALTAELEIVDGGIPKSLTGKPGDPEAGKKAMINRKLGNCLACHTLTSMADQPFHGEIGPTLDGVADRYEEPQLRLIVANAKAIFDGTIMPGFLVSDGLSRVAKKFEGKSILEPANVEDIVAFLLTLKE